MPWSLFDVTKGTSIRRAAPWWSLGTTALPVGSLINTHTPGTLSMNMAVYHLQSFKEVKEKHPCWSADLNNTAEPAGHPYCYLSRERKKITPHLAAQGQPDPPSFLHARCSVRLSQAPTSSSQFWHSQEWQPPTANCYPQTGTVFLTALLTLPQAISVGIVALTR